MKINMHLHKQQTPNPDAQVPEAVPPNFEQSEELQHVPLLPAVDAHASFLKVTMVKSDKTEKSNMQKKSNVT